MLAHARRPLPVGTPLCILQRERVDTVGALGPEPFPLPPCLRWAPACTLLPAGVSPAAGRGQPEWGWAGGPASHLGSDPRCQPVLPSLPAPVPCGSPGGPTGQGWQLPVGWPQALGQLPAPSGPSCAPARGFCCSSLAVGVPQGSLQWHWPVPGSPGPCGPPLLVPCSCLALS